MMRRFVSKFPRWTIGFRKFDDFLYLLDVLILLICLCASSKVFTKPDSNGIIVKNLYVSIDPYQLNRMKCFSSSQKASGYAVSLAPGHVIDAYGVGKVVASENPEFEKGDLGLVDSQPMLDIFKFANPRRVKSVCSIPILSLWAVGFFNGLGACCFGYLRLLWASVGWGPGTRAFWGLGAFSMGYGLSRSWALGLSQWAIGYLGAGLWAWGL
ncbi:hypothetical protein FNV43_RR03454 [Rhamnella rubrinervis]|uniref:Oxidoreductase N-terminal domain-containing protein n=1 Tax=Rhamnella rubrinervis TaxID=2594499 RepID=A0A8K0MNQ3_9ROSA|nr:hypothetical protein FNV43_RR03454 [Rhamnella rubrinervis]